MGRFINADAYTATSDDILDNNMFAYCGNNPVMGYDPTGNVDWGTFFSGVSLLSVGITACVVAAAVVSGGACVPLLVAAGATFAAGGMTIANGAAEVIESTTNYNFMRDGVYKGDARYYEQQKVFFETAAEVGTTAISLASGSTSLCFVAGTMILVAEGVQAIETIESGDKVWAWDEETGEVALKEVVETYINETDELVHICISGEEIVTTPSHPFYSPVKGWIDAADLRAGDILLRVNGEYVVVEKVQHEILEVPITVYNFQVEDYHTYYVTETGVLVHNSCTNEPWLSVRESTSAFNTTKGLPPAQYEAYENVLTKLASGDMTGLHIHPSAGGLLSADVKGFGGGRGAARVLYAVSDGVVDIIRVVLNHKF